MLKSEVSAISSENELNNIFAAKSENKEKNLKANTMLEKMGFRDEELTSKTHDDIFVELMNKELLFNIGLLINRYIKKEDMVISPEHPVVTNNNFVIGYIDILLSVHDDNVSIPIEIKTEVENNIGATIRQINTYKLHLKNSDFVIIAPKITNKQKDIFTMSGMDLMSMTDVYEAGIKYKELKDNFINKCIPMIVSNLKKENETTINLSYFGDYFESYIVYRIIRDILETTTNIYIKDRFSDRIVFCYKSYLIEIEKREQEELEKRQKVELERKQKEEFEKRQTQVLEDRKLNEKLREKLKNRDPNEF